MTSAKNFFQTAADSLTSFVSKLGTSRDKSATVEYVFSPLTRTQILSMYRGAWLPRKIIEIPADDAVREWRDWQATKDQIKAIEEEENRLQLKQKLHEVLIKARLWGGCALFIGDGSFDLMSPLDPEKIGKGGLKHLTVIPRLHLSVGEIGTDPTSEYYNKPLFYNVSGVNGTSAPVHPSRVAVFYGPMTGDEVIIDCWGDSVLQSVYTAVKNADSSAENVASLIFEAKVDVFRIPSFMTNLSDPEYLERLMKRFTLVATNKGINGAVVLDKEEEYEQKEITFGALPDILDRFMQIVSGAADIPMTRLFGQSPAGMSSTGENDLRNYYDKVKSHQKLSIAPALRLLDECLIRSALGSRDPDIWYNWASLWQVSAKELAEIGEKASKTIDTLAATGLFSPEALAVSGANMLVERGILPGFEQAIEDAPDYDPIEALNPEPDEDAPQEKKSGNDPASV